MGQRWGGGRWEAKVVFCSGMLPRHTDMGKVAYQVCRLPASSMFGSKAGKNHAIGRAAIVVHPHHNEDTPLREG